MDETIEQILKKLPYNTYEDIFNAFYNNKAKITFNTADATNIASIKHPNMTLLGLYVPFLISLVFIIMYCIFINYWWLLLSLPFLFIINFLINYFPIHKISYITIIIALFFEIPSWIIILAITLLIIKLNNYLWWKITYKNTIYELETNQEAFVWMWNRHGIIITDAYGKKYSHLSTSVNTNREDDLVYNKSIKQQTNEFADDEDD